MRHLWSFLAGVVAAPLAWLCLATGQPGSSQAVATWNEESFFDTADLIGPAAFLVAAGVLLGLVGTLRWSPVGPLVAGLLYVIPTVFMFINPFRTLEAFSVDQEQRLLEQDLQPWVPVENGTLLVLGALLLMAVFSAQRWRRRPAVAGALPAGAAQPVAAGTDSVSEQPASMSDEEILAAAAAMEEEEKAAGGEAPAEPAEPAEPAKAKPAKAKPAKAEPAKAESAKPPPAKQKEPAPDNDESTTRSGSSTH